MSQLDFKLNPHLDHFNVYKYTNKMLKSKLSIGSEKVKMSADLHYAITPHKKLSGLSDVPGIV